MRIVLTGGIASGKSTVARILVTEYGFCELDADVVSREVANDPCVLSAVAQTFGAQFVTDGVLDRRALRRYVFGNAERKRALDAIFHGRIYAVLEARLAATDGDVVVSIPLYFECGRTLDGIDEVWTVSAHTDTRIKRIVLRDNTTEEQARAVLGSQWSDAEREARSDRVLTNDGDPSALREQVAAALNEIRCPSAKASQS